MPSKNVILTGSLPKIKPEDATRLAVYLVRGKTILASSAVQENGGFRLSASRDAVAAEGNQALEAVVGPAGLTGSLPDSPALQRVRLNRADIAKTEKEVSISKQISLDESALALLLRWCRKYCISGTVVGQDGCAVPGATVTVYSVGFTGYGYSKVPRATVNADQYGNFTACFTWCTSLFPCWPCWPIWWFCWPWWWEWDLLHVIEILEKSPIGPGPVENITQGLALIRPSGKDLVRGQGFAVARNADFQFSPDEKRTALIQRKLANPKLRAVFPWWWWCCDDPNIVFSVNQGANTILNENPATDTRWCLEDGSFVTLVANDSAVTACPPDPQPESGFAWTRVGNITVDLIHQGYADGFAGNDASDLAFADTLDIYGQFAPGTPVSYYQVDAGQWSGNPARGGTAPLSSSPLGVDLYNHLFIYDAGFNLVFAGQVKMGPFTGGGITNLYATEQSRRGAPTGTGLDPLPALPAGGFELWAYQGLKVSTPSGNLVMGSLGAVDLTLTGYDAAFNPVTLAPDAPLTLTIDNQGLTTMHINAVTAYKWDGTLAPLESSATTDCPAYVIGPGGYVTIDVTAKDNNGHIFEYQVDAEWGHGHSATVTPPSTRGYAVNTSPFPITVSVPNLAQKSFVGGSEVMTYFPTTNCCYEFRIRAGKRVTQGYTYPGLSDFDFQTISLKIS